MFKLLIVEDERWEREGLVDFIDWESYEIAIAGTACNGIEGLEHALKICPDIIITDIKMPGMDGILMSKKIKEKLPDTKIIILTGYDDFVYAKEAISFNANGYILKNCEEEEMTEVIEKVVRECKKERKRTELENNFNEIINQNITITRQAFFTNLLEGNYNENEIQRNFDDFGIESKLNDVYTIAVVKLKDGESGRYIQEVLLNREPSPGAAAVLEEIEHSVEKSKVFSLSNFGLHEMVFCFSNVTINYLEAEMANLVNVISSKYKTDLVVGIGEGVNSVINLRQAYLHARHSLEFRAFWGGTGIEASHNLDAMYDLFSPDASEFLIRSNYYSKQLIHSIRAMDEERVHSMLEELFQHFHSYKGVSRDMVTNILQSTVNDIFVLIYNLNSSGEQPDLEKYNIYGKAEYLLEIKIIKDEISQYAKNAISSIGLKKLSKDEQIIKNVLKIIDNKYVNDINLKVIASEVYLSPNYLGQMFKKHTGKSINDYISGFRMERAKELLKLPSEKINTVANKVGIPNASYFCTVFKNLYGIAPGEYQKLVMENPDIEI
ncbi:MAG: transcriptional regulator [Eubacterium sp.]|nr:transcriptional regulator [Eubacterium sp.]